MANMEEAVRKKEYEALWQLEMWKKAEEAKFNAYLKEKSQFHLAELVKESKAKEEAREKEFSEVTESVRKLQQSMGKKARELQKREQKLLTLEDELRRKIGEAAKQLASKEEEIISVKTKCKEEKVGIEKEKAGLAEQLSVAKQQLSEMTDRYALLKKEFEESSMNQLKQEISAKELEVLELEKKLEKSVQAKELYKSQYDKIKEEIIRIREAVQLAREQEMKRQAEEIDKLRFQITMQKQPEEQSYKPAKPALESVRMSGKKEEQTARQSNVFLHNYEGPEPQHTEPTFQPKGTKERLLIGELERLMAERKELLESGLYNEGDEIIKVLSTQIAEALKSNS